MKLSVALALIVGLVSFFAGMVTALSGAADDSRLVACAIMVAGLIVVTAASFRWAAAPRPTSPRKGRPPVTSLHHTSGVIAGHHRQPHRSSQRD